MSKRKRTRVPAASTTLRNLLEHEPTPSEIAAWNGAVSWLHDWCDRQELRSDIVPSIENYDTKCFAEELRDRVLPKMGIPEPRKKAT